MRDAGLFRESFGSATRTRVAFATKLRDWQSRWICRRRLAAVLFNPQSSIRPPSLKATAGKQSAIVIATRARSTSVHIDYATELNEQQLAAVTAAPGPLLVIAGAGSG
jgi:hypothetical protein